MDLRIQARNHVCRCAEKFPANTRRRILLKAQVRGAGIAHARRKFFEVHEAKKSPVAQHALLEIANLYEVEAEAKDLYAAERAALRRARAGPILDRFKAVAAKNVSPVTPRSALAKAIGYTLNRWAALTRSRRQSFWPV